MIKTCKQIFKSCISCFFLAFYIFPALCQEAKPKFKVIAFYTAKEDLAHISFVHEANAWFPKIAAKYNFEYDSTNDWNNLNPEFLSHYQVVLFLDTRPNKKGSVMRLKIIWIGEAVG